MVNFANTDSTTALFSKKDNVLIQMQIHDNNPSRHHNYLNNNSFTKIVKPLIQRYKNRNYYNQISTLIHEHNPISIDKKERNTDHKIVKCIDCEREYCEVCGKSI